VAYAETARERERARIERDLHDDLGGNLSALKMMFSHLQKQLPQTPLLQERSDYLIRLIDRSIESIHRIAADLRPGILDAGLVAALEWLAQEQRQQAGVACTLHCAQQDIMMNPALATSLFRIAQEACNNIRKHAQATRIDLRLYESGGELVLEVCDDGIGIPEQRRHDAHAFGLLGMSERMAVLGGRFDLKSCNGHGTTVRVTAPLDAG
jgi:signal transduction histidine kinase